MAFVGSLLSANAAVAASDRLLTLRVADPVVDEGELVALNGRVKGADRRMWVRLQHWDDGRWTSIQLKLARRDGRYRFRVAPDNGVQRYRTRLVRKHRPGIGNSEPVTVWVRWTPDLTATAAHEGRADGVTTTVTGESSVPDVVLVRQLEVGDGWSDDGAATVGSEGAWVDEFESGHGTRVRYVLERDGPRLQARTTPFEVDGTYTPTFEDVQLTMDDFSAWARLTVQTQGLEPGTVVWAEEQQPDGSWSRFVGSDDYYGYTVVDVDGTASNELRPIYGRAYRWRADPAGPRQEAISEVTSLSTMPYPEIKVGSVVSYSVPEGLSSRSFPISLEAGQTLIIHGLSFIPTVTGPSGEELPATSSGAEPPLPTTVSWVAQEAGVHELTVSAASPTPTMHVSSPIEIDAEVDGETFDVETEFLGQWVDLRFEGENLPLVSQAGLDQPGGTRGTSALIAPGGTQVDRITRLEYYGHHRAWRLSGEPGTYTLRLLPWKDSTVSAHGVGLLSPAEGTIDLNDEAGFTADLTTPGRVGLATFDASESGYFSFTADGVPAIHYIVYPGEEEIDNGGTPSGAELLPTGRYQLYMTTDEPGLSSAYVSTPVQHTAEIGSDLEWDVGSIPSRAVEFTLTGEPGEVYSLYQVCDDSVQYHVDVRDWDDSNGVWYVHSSRAPLVAALPDEGTVTLSHGTCTPTGITQIRDVDVLPVLDAPNSVEVEALIDEPGEVFLFDDDPERRAAQLRVTSRDSTFPTGTKITFFNRTPGYSHWDGSQSHVDEIEQIVRPSFYDPQQYMVWVGPTVTGSTFVKVDTY